MYTYAQIWERVLFSHCSLAKLLYGSYQTHTTHFVNILRAVVESLFFIGGMGSGILPLLLVIPLTIHNPLTDGCIPYSRLGSMTWFSLNKPHRQVSGLWAMMSSRSPLIIGLLLSNVWRAATTNTIGLSRWHQEVCFVFIVGGYYQELRTCADDPFYDLIR